ncbi:GNAT family N-acetyltransferase [Actinokineospora pegani]|uniref:GNAT family N-acetyltransferase n=1 Tax=Actinokineospora pegani TaxID=2654637 RepID=UPI0018D47BE1|nr:GNAT family N-acetyltransferase [Actinokineospora pegani]
MRLVSPVLVREATAEDAAAVGEVHAEAWRQAYRDLFEPDWLTRFVDARRVRWDANLNDPAQAGDTILVAQRDRDVVAFAWSGPHPDNPADAELRAFYAHPTTWGTGVARALLDGVADTVADYRRVRLWAMAGANRARRFYAREGFTETGLIRERDFGDGRPVLELEYARRPATP